jgi:hypothetical protein
VARTSAAALAVCLVTAAALEGLVRWSGYADRYVYGPVYQPWTMPEVIPYVHKPGLRDALGLSRTRFSTDALGLRSAQPDRPLEPRPAGEYRIAVLGDSITFGQGVATPETFCEVLEQRLGQIEPARRFRVFNFGVAGYSVREMLETLRRRVPEVGANLVVLALILSDFDLDRCGKVDRWGYLHNRKLRSYDDPDALRYRLLRQLHLSYLARDAAVRFGLIGGKGDAGAAIVPGQVPPSYSYVAAAARLARERGVPLLVVLLPNVQYDGPELEGVRRRLSEDGTELIDLSRLRSEFSRERYGVSRHDAHPGPAVHRRIGEALAEAIERQTRVAR